MKQYFVLTVPMKTELWQEHRIEKIFRICEIFYNDIQRNCEKKYHEMIETEEWTSTIKLISSKKEDYIQNPSEETSKKLSAAYKKQREIIRKAGFSEFSFQKMANQLRKQPRYKLIDSTMAYSIGIQCYKAFDKLIFEDGKTIHYKKKGSLKSIANVQNNAGLRIVKRNGRYFCQWGKHFSIPLLINMDNSYEKNAFTNEIKYCRIKKIGKINVTHYYCQITFEGILPKKTNRNLEFSKKGCVKIRVDEETVEVQTLKKKNACPLSPGFKDLDSKIKKIEQKMENSKFVNNPKNYDKNQKPRCSSKLKWYYSNRYKSLARKRRNYYRIMNRQRKIHQDVLVNEILHSGDTFLIEKNYFGKKELSKGWNKSIRLKQAFTSPSGFVETLTKKLEYYPCEFSIK